RLDVFQMDYDDVANTTTTTDGMGHSTVHQFDAMGREVATTDPLGRTASVEWDGVNTISTTDKRGSTRRFTHDAVDRLKVTEEFEAGATPPTTTLATEYRDATSQRVDTDRRGIQQVSQFDALGRIRRLSRQHLALTAEYGMSTV